MLFTQIGLAIAFTTNSYATRQILHHMRDLDLARENSELHVIADVIKKNQL